MGKKVERYSDIIDLPYHQSMRRPHMPNYNRAAQFAPFAALVGYGQMVQDTADILMNDKKKLLTEDAKQFLDKKLQILKKHSMESPVIEVIYYNNYAGVNRGKYCVVSGKLKKIVDYPSVLILGKNVQILCSDILDIHGQIFEKYQLI